MYKHLNIFGLCLHERILIANVHVDVEAEEGFLEHRVQTDTGWTKDIVLKVYKSYL